MRRVKADVDKYKSEAVKAAAENAKLRATDIATVLGVSLGSPIKVEEIRESDFMTQRTENLAYQKMSYDSDRASGAYRLGETGEGISGADLLRIKVGYRMLVQFEIKK